MVNKNFSVTENMTYKLQSLKFQTKLKIHQNVSDCFDQIKCNETKQYFSI